MATASHCASQSSTSRQVAHTPVSGGRQSTLCTTARAPPSGHSTWKFASAVTATTLAGCHCPPPVRARHGYPIAHPIGALPSSADLAFALRIWSSTCIGSAPPAEPPAASLVSKRDLRLRPVVSSAPSLGPAPSSAVPSLSADSVNAMACSAGGAMMLDAPAVHCCQATDDTRSK